jgi:probable addiction module antidote protein
MEQTTIQTRPWDVAEHLETAEDMAAYLDAALEDGDTAVVVAALGDIARAKGVAQIAREAGLGRESLYKAPSTTGNPEFATILKVVRALGLQLHVQAARA